MKIEIPTLREEIREGELVREEKTILLDIDTSVYSEERWEQNFPLMAQHEGLFQYIERVSEIQTSDRVRVVAMLKALYCFVESSEIPTYKAFAQMFSLSATDYTERLINKLLETFRLITGSSTVKN